MAMSGGTAYKVLSKKPNYGSASWTIDLYVYVKVGTYDIASNTTPLSLGMYVKTPGTDYDISWDDFSGSYLGIGAFGGGSESLTTFTKSVSGGGTIWLKENVNVTVKHNADGTAKGVPIKWKWGVNSPWGQYVIPSGTLSVDLPTIPRVSSISAVNGTIGSAVSLNISRQSSAFTHTLSYHYGSKKGTIVEKTDKVSYSWTPPMDFCNETPGSTYGEGTIICDTYSGDTLVGSSSAKLTLNVPSSVKLTCEDGWATVEPYNSGTAVDGVNAYVKGLSKAEIVIDPGKISTKNSYGATISSYKVVYNGGTLNAPYRTPLLNAVGTFSIICYVYDTRGRSESVTLNFTVVDYAPPMLKNVVCFRCKADGTQASNGTYIFAQATSDYYDLGGNNSASIKVRYKAGSGSYSQPIALTSGVGKVIGDGQILTKATYLVEFSITDSVSGVASLYNTYVLSDKPFFHGKRGGNGAAIGKFSELDDTFDVAWDLMVRGDYYGSVFSLGKTYQVQSGEDVNNFTNFGVYSVATHERAKSVLNLPTPWAGRLVVSSASGEGLNMGPWVYLHQEYILLEGNARYIRLLHTDGNGDWNYGDWLCITGHKGWAALGFASAVGEPTADVGRGAYGNCYYRVENGNHVYVAFNCAFDYKGSPISVSANAIPTEYRPKKNVYSLCAGYGRTSTRVAVDTGGLVYIDSVQIMSDSSPTNNIFMNWIDGYIDYWI